MLWGKKKKMGRECICIYYCSDHSTEPVPLWVCSPSVWPKVCKWRQNMFLIFWELGKNTGIIFLFLNIFFSVWGIRFLRINHPPHLIWWQCLDHHSYLEQNLVLLPERDGNLPDGNWTKGKLQEKRTLLQN